MQSKPPNADPPFLPTRVVGAVGQGLIRIVYGVGIGWMDGGVETTIDADLLPPDLRVPNALFEMSIRSGKPVVKKRDEPRET